MSKQPYHKCSIAVLLSLLFVAFPFHMVGKGRLFTSYKVINFLLFSTPLIEVIYLCYFLFSDEQFILLFDICIRILDIYQNYPGLTQFFPTISLCSSKVMPKLIPLSQFECSV